jgi:hypothetical protein
VGVCHFLLAALEGVCYVLLVAFEGVCYFLLAALEGGCYLLLVAFEAMCHFLLTVLEFDFKDVSFMEDFRFEILHFCLEAGYSRFIPLPPSD